MNMCCSHLSRRAGKNTSAARTVVLDDADLSDARLVFSCLLRVELYDLHLQGFVLIASA